MGTLAIGAATVAIWVYLLFFRGGFWRTPYRSTAVAGNPATRSVIAVIPARDEAATIARAVTSLLSQDYLGDFHVILIDDESTEGTAELARAAAAAANRSDRLTICRGTTLPPGWTGKLWAMREGVGAARQRRPDYLLLTDADIVHAAGNLRELVVRAEVEAFDLVSLMVRLHCRTFSEMLLIPAFVFFFFKLYPPAWVADPGRRTAAAAGGCMLVRASILDRIGGLDSIRNEIIDDCALARRIKSVGKVWLGPAMHATSLREYRPLAALVPVRVGWITFQGRGSVGAAATEIPSPAGLLLVGIRLRVPGPGWDPSTHPGRPLLSLWLAERCPHASHRDQQWS